MNQNRTDENNPVKLLRKKLHLRNQTALAIAMGVSREKVSQWERGLSSDLGVDELLTFAVSKKCGDIAYSIAQFFRPGKAFKVFKELGPEALTPILKVGKEGQNDLSISLREGLEEILTLGESESVALLEHTIEFLRRKKA